MCLPGTRGTAGLDSRDLSASPGARRAGREDGPLSQPGRRQRAGKNVAPHRGAVIGPDQPPRGCLAWLGTLINLWVFPRSSATAPVRYQPAAFQTPLTAGAPELRPPARTAGRATEPGHCAGHAGSCSPTGSDFAPQHRAWPTDGGPRQEGGVSLVRRAPTALSLRVGGAEGPAPSGHRRKSVYSALSCPFLPSGFGNGTLSFEFAPLYRPADGTPRQRPAPPPAGPAGSMADPAQCGRCALPPSLLLEALPPLAAAGRSCQSGSGSHGGRE